MLGPPLVPLYFSARIYTFVHNFSHEREESASASLSNTLLTVQVCISNLFCVRTADDARRKEQCCYERKGTMKACESFMRIPELIGMFFMHCIPEEITDPSFTTAPLQLILVCTSWKKIAEGMPDLWRRFRIDLSRLIDLSPEEACLGIEKCSVVLERFLRYSRERLLDVGMIHPCEDLSVPETSLQTLYSTFYAQQDRWSNATLHLPYEMIGSLSSTTLKHLHMDLSSLWKYGRLFDVTPLLDDCPSLEDLVVIGPHIEEEYEQVTDPALLSLCCPPSLQTLEIRSSYIYIDSYEDFLGELKNWGTANVWKLVFVDVEIFGEVFLENFHLLFPSLTRLEILHPHDFGAFEIWQPLPHPIRVQELQHLRLLLHYWHLLSAFRTPNLSSLDLEEGYFDALDDEQDDRLTYSRCNPKSATRLDSNLLTTFIKRNRIKLEVFHLSIMRFNERELIECLSCMPHLEELCVEFQCEEAVADQLLPALSERSRTQSAIESNGFTFVDVCILCPVLTVFTLTVDSTDCDVSKGAVVGLIKSRQVLSEDGKHRVAAWRQLALPSTEESLKFLKERLSADFLSSTLA